MADEWAVKSMEAMPKGSGQWQVSSMEAANPSDTQSVAAANTMAMQNADPRTGAGMELAAGAKEQARMGQPIIDAANREVERQIRLGAAMNRASRSPTPFTNAIAATDPIGAARMLLGAKLGSAIGQRISPEYGGSIGGLIGGIGAGLGPPTVNRVSQMGLEVPDKINLPGGVKLRIRQPLEEPVPTGPSQPISESPNIANQKWLAQQHEAFAQRLKTIEDTRQQELSSYERLKEQQAQALQNRGKEQASMDAAHEGRLSALEQARQREIAAHEQFIQQHAAALNARGGAPKLDIPEVKAVQSAIKGAQEQFTQQDLISRTRRVSIPGEEPTPSDLKRAGDLTQAPLAKVRALAKFGDKLAQNELNRRLKNE